MNREGLVCDVMVRGHPGQCNHARVVFNSWGSKEWSQQNCHLRLLESRDSGLFRSLVDRVPWKAFLKGRGVQEGWTFFKKEILQVQE